jgi:DNA-binding NarL/FixJ family response regulator
MNTETQTPSTTRVTSQAPSDITMHARAVSALGIPEGHVLVLGLLPLQKGVVDGVSSGNIDLVMQGVPFDEFLRTIRILVAESSPEGQSPNPPVRTFFPQSTDAQDREALRSAALTSRERQVMGLIGEGMSNKEIAIRLNVAIHTVKTHVHKVLQKLAVRTRLEVAALLHTTVTAQARNSYSKVA